MKFNYDGKSIIPPVGLALGGGGARGAAHLGVLQYWDSLGIKIAAISGTSAGAIVAALYAFGIPLKVIEENLIRLKPAPISTLKMSGLGLFENRDLRFMLQELLPSNAQIEDATINLAIHTTNLLNGESVILKSGPVIESVMASSCVPGFYRPWELDDKILVDGGLTENVPLSSLRSLGAHFLIGVNLNGVSVYKRPEGMFDVITNALDIAIDAQTRRQLREAHVLLNMDLTAYSRSSAKDFYPLMKEGRELAQNELKDINSLYWRAQWRDFIKMLKGFLPVHMPLHLLRIKEWWFQRKIKLNNLKRL